LLSRRADAAHYSAGASTLASGVIVVVMPESIAGIVVPASGGGAPHVLAVMRPPARPPNPAMPPPAALHAWPIGHSVSDAHCCVCVAEHLDWQDVLGKNMLNPPARPPNPAGAAASVAAIEPPSAEPEQHTCPEEQSAPVLHSFEVPEHEPTATQEEDIDGIITIVQHVWPDEHLFDDPLPPPPPPPAPGNNAAKPESGPQVTLARRLPSIPRGLAAAALESSPGLTVLPSSEAPPSGAAVVPEDEEPNAAASASPKNAITPRESRTGDMRISKVGPRSR
jgi:hypothetical protein